MDKWVSLEYISEYLDVSKDTIRNWIKKENGIPAYKIGKQWKFKLSDVDNWIKSSQSSKFNKEL